MRGLVFLGDRKLALQEFPDPTPDPGEVVLAIKASGMCGCDLNHYRGEGGATTFDISKDLLRRQLTIHACWTFSAVGQAECARFIVDRKVPLNRLLTHRFTLDEAEAAYNLFDTQTTGKGVFVF